MTNISGVPSTPDESETRPTVDSTEENDSTISDKDKSLLSKVSEVGEDAVKRIKDILADVDKDELRKSMNKENVRRSLATTLDTLNKKAQALLVPKDENASAGDSGFEKWAPDASTDPIGTDTTSGLGPVGSETLSDNTSETVDAPAKDDATKL